MEYSSKWNTHQNGTLILSKWNTHQKLEHSYYQNGILISKKQPRTLHSTYPFWVWSIRHYRQWSDVASGASSGLHPLGIHYKEHSYYQNGILIIKMEHSYYQKEYSSSKWNTHII